MNVKSVASMIKQAASNANLYDKMLAAGYTDGEFPSWWYSPGRAGGEGAEAGGEGAAAGKIVDVPAEGAELRIDVDKVEGVEGYEPTPPRIPAPREGGQLYKLSTPMQSKAMQSKLSKVHHLHHLQQASPMLSYPC